MPLTLNQQVRKFSQMISNWKEDYIAKSLFMISIADASAQQAFVISVINRLKYNIEMLYSSGASKFVVHNVAPLGSLPIVRQEFNTGNECYEKFNDLAKQHNARLGPMLNELAKAKPGFQFTLFDFYNDTMKHELPVLLYEYIVLRYWVAQRVWCGFPNVHSKLCEYQRSYLYFDA
ncbi:hypothetical protein HID58_028333, partial [Brassica napus]